jgi:hypothetical protein
MGHHPDRNAPFANITRLRREYEAAADAVIAIDTKKQELLESFHRAGTTFTAETVETCDHDFGSAGQRKLIPHGIYDMVQHHKPIHLNTSHDTSALCCDSVALWREQAGRAAPPWRNGCWCWVTAAAATAPRRTCSRKTCKGWRIG